MSRDEDPMWLKWQDAAARIYEPIYYEPNTLVGHINRAGHRILEQPFEDKSRHVGKVVEVGAGTGKHLPYVQHTFDRYYLTDTSGPMLDVARRAIGERGDVTIMEADASKLPFERASCDRLISVYNLEHMPEPHRVLEEWKRVVAPGGTVSIAIPAEGGIPWNLGRYLTTRRAFKREGLDLDYIIAREHINACYRLVALIRHAFPNRKEAWWPARVIPHPHFNLLYCCTATV